MRPRTSYLLTASVVAAAAVTLLLLYPLDAVRRWQSGLSCNARVTQRSGIMAC